VAGLDPGAGMGHESAHLFAPSRVFVVDRVDYRLELAEELGGVPVSLDRPFAQAKAFLHHHAHHPAHRHAERVRNFRSLKP